MRKFSHCVTAAAIATTTFCLLLIATTSTLNNFAATAAASSSSSSTRNKRSSGGEEKCKDGISNLVISNSDDSEKPLPAIIKNFSGTVYNLDGSPSCANGRPSAALPGYVTLIDGTLHMPRSYDLIKSAIMKVTARTPGLSGTLCIDGVSQYLALPNKFCRVELCHFITNDVCEILGQKGVHSVNELHEKLKMNMTLRIPEPPSLLGISILDIFSGDYAFEFTIEVEGENILRLKLPTNEEFVQIGVDDDDDD